MMGEPRAETPNYPIRPMTDFRALCAELLKAIAPYRLLDDLNAEARIRTADRLNSVVYRAKTALEGDWQTPPTPPAEGEVAELVKDLREQANHGYCEFISRDDLRRAADLLERQAQQTLPQGLIPMEYADADSSARIVSEPSEDGPGGCWVVINSRHVNPCTEFPTAEAAWDALQRAQSLPSTVGPFDRIKFTCHLVPREQADD